MIGDLLADIFPCRRVGDGFFCGSGHDDASCGGHFCGRLDWGSWFLGWFRGDHGGCFVFFLFLVVVIVFGVVEVFIVPDLFVEGGLGYVADIEDYVVGAGREAGHAEVGAGGLQGVEEEAGGFVVELSGDEEAHDLHEGDLDGVGVLEDGECEGGDAATGAVGAELDAFVLESLVEITEAVAAQGGRSALSAVDFEMLTAIGKFRHFLLLPPTRWSSGISGLARKLDFIYGLQ